MKFKISLFFFLSVFILKAQPAPSSATKVMEGIEMKEKMNNSSLVKNIPFKNIGPTVMSGRVVNIAVNPDDPTEFYVGYASGGLWHTRNNGTSFTPVLDATATQNVGDIAVHWKTGTIWVGTGENNSSRSSYAGIGMLKSTDKGATWQHMGLTDSHHIGRIVINHENVNEVLVGVTGHLYSPNAERGVYKTTDGGKSWKKTLFINEETGIIDLAVSPNDFSIQYAAAWEKDRKAWNFEGNGSGSGIYKSTDAGNSWKLISGPNSGFPTGEGVGRIGLAVYDNDMVYVVHDNQSRRTKSDKEKDDKEGLTKEDFKTMSVKDFLDLKDVQLDEFLKDNNFQEKYKAQNVKEMVRGGAVKPIDLAAYLEDANSLLFDTPVIGAEVYRSKDAGKTWKKQNDNYIDDLFYSYGYYFAQIRVDRNNPDKIYLAGVPLIASDDGGKTYKAIDGDNVHADHHALWVNPVRPGHLINGNDGGVNISYDDGGHWIKNNSPEVGQFYAINIDHEKPYNVYGGLQDNGVWMGPHNAQENSRWHSSGDYPWKAIMGGDGMQVQIDNRNSNIVYTGFQFGNYFRIDLANEKRAYIQPKHELGEKPYRFNWQTPILLSSHNQDILYFGGNKLHRSLNQGDDWEAISEDLTKGGREGNVAYGTLTSISESPFKFGLLYTGSDDGLIYVSSDGGGNWKKISDKLPQDLWVSRVVASKHKKERVYASLNGYRWDNFAPYVYKSEDMGQTWTNIAANLPASSVNVILEDPANDQLLFVGTDNGLYASFDQGASWELLQNGIPNVAIHDLVVQPEAKHLVVGTHGRSIYKADIAHLPAIKHSSRWGNARSSWSEPNTPGMDIAFYSKSKGNYKASIMTLDGIEVSAFELEADKGYNILSYDVAFSKEGKSAYLKKNKMALKTADNGKTYLPKGSYELVLKGNGSEEKMPIKIE